MISYIFLSFQVLHLQKLGRSHAWQTLSLPPDLHMADMAEEVRVFRMVEELSR